MSLIFLRLPESQRDLTSTMCQSFSWGSVRKGDHPIKIFFSAIFHYFNFVAILCSFIYRLLSVTQLSHNYCFYSWKCSWWQLSVSQSRQSAKLFLQSSELGLPHSLTRRRVCPPPLVPGGTFACGGWGVCGVSAGLRVLSQWVQLRWTWNPNKLWRSNSTFNLLYD